MDTTLEPVREEPVVNTKVESLTIKKKPTQLVKKDITPSKIDLSKKENDAISEPKSKGDVLSPVENSTEERKEDNVGLQEVGSTHTESKESSEKKEEKEVTIINSNENINTDSVERNLKTQQKSSIELPENIDKLVEFMKNTGGDLEDYVRLNADYSKINDTQLLKEYYKNNKPYLSQEEIDLQLEDKFAFDEEYDDEKSVLRKRIAIKEEVEKAKSFLEETKSKYYQEIKLRPGTTQEQTKAMDFFNRYNDRQEVAQQQHEVFKKDTNHYFSEFKGFDFNVGEKKFKYQIGNPSDVASKQSNIQDFVKTFLNEDGTVKDYNGYHKAIYAARNVDTLVKHFYEQGISDATKNVVASSKNINKKARPTGGDDISIGGMKIKAVSGVDSSRLKINKKR
jgi:hypothetical protein